MLRAIRNGAKNDGVGNENYIIRKSHMNVDTFSSFRSHLALFFSFFNASEREKESQDDMSQ